MLGELWTEGGALSRVVLSEEGERAIGESVASWQTEGVPFCHALSDVVYQESVSVRDPSFLEAVRQWSAAMRYQVLTLHADVFACWQLMAQLPLEPVQRYSMLLSLRMLDNEKRTEWMHALEEASRAVHAEQQKTNAKLKQLHQ